MLTDWCVIRALAASGWPEELASFAGAQAAFVSEISAYLRFRALDLREAEAETRVLAAIEAVYRRSGGAEYGVAKEALEMTQSGYLLALGPTSDGVSCLAVELRRCEWRLDRARHPLADEARRAGRVAAENYWKAVAACRVPEGFFANVPENGAIAALRARFDIWWALFLHALRSVLRETNPAYARLLQALPHLRAEAASPGQKFVLTALVQEWREENAERFGLFKDIHFPVVEQRAFVKYRDVQEWFDGHARGYKRDALAREAATEALYLALKRMPPAQQQAYWNN